MCVRVRSYLAHLPALFVVIVLRDASYVLGLVREVCLFAARGKPYLEERIEAQGCRPV